MPSAMPAPPASPVALIMAPCPATRLAAARRARTEVVLTQDMLAVANVTLGCFFEDLSSRYEDNNRRENEECQENGSKD